MVLLMSKEALVTEFELVFFLIRLFKRLLPVPTLPPCDADDFSLADVLPFLYDYDPAAYPSVAYSFLV